MAWSTHEYDDIPGTYVLFPLTVVPLAVNTVQHPLPTPRRGFMLGKALGEAIA